MILNKNSYKRHSWTIEEMWIERLYYGITTNILKYEIMWLFRIMSFFLGDEYENDYGEVS